MGDIFLNYPERNKAMETSAMGIPIPRSQHNTFMTMGDYSQLSLDGDAFSPCPPLVPNNSLANNSGFSDMHSFEMNASNFGFMPSSTNEFDDIEIKMEPLDDFLDLGSIPTHQRGPEDNLLDDVNFEDLLNPEEMETSTTCLDPQHSSPAAMAAVRPDEIFGQSRLDMNNSHGLGFTSAMNVPIKTENNSSHVASTFPPQGIGWKDPFLNVGGNHLFSSDMPTHAKNYQGQTTQAAASPMQDQLDIGYKCESPFSPDSNSSALHELLVNSPSTSHSTAMSPQSNLSPSPQLMQGIPIGQSVPAHHSFLAANNLSMSRLSSSAPTNDASFENVWQRREPRRHLLSTGTVDEEIGGSTSSLSTGCGVMSPMPNDFSMEDAADSDDDSDVEHYDSESDNDSLRSEDHVGFGISPRKEKHFWQYNIQSKGPKGHRVAITKPETDPHQLEQVMDPVFSPVCSIQGIKHSGKARRGDGNDLTPSPRKLVTIGTELEKLNKKINEMTPVSELPNNIRSKSRKEKNKLASRACRLKKKAQHEANKIKLHGLDQEHRAMMALVHKVRTDLLKKVALMQAKTETSLDDNQIVKAQQQLSAQIEKNSRNKAKQRIAGNTTEFVNRVIENCRNGNPTGGLDELLQSFLRTSLSTSDLSSEP